MNIIYNENTVYMKENKNMYFLETIKQETSAAPKSPWVLNSHLALRLLSREIPAKKFKAVFAIRNHKDVKVSYYWHDY